MAPGRYDQAVRELLGEVEGWRARGERFALATVVATRRSAPRPVGAKLAIGESGALAGSVSGSCVEVEVAEAARAILAGAPPRVLSFGIADDLALEVGLPCGGEIDVFVERADSEALEAMWRAAACDAWCVRFVVVAGDSVGTDLLVLESGERVGDTTAAFPDVAGDLIRGGRSRVLDIGRDRIFCDVAGPPPRLLVFGAVDTAEALCRAARTIGWRTIVADPRARFATRERIPSAHELVAEWPEDAFARVRPDHATAVVVLTHEDRFDIPALAAALESDAFYVGALGSRRNQERRAERLLEAGVAAEDVARIAGPCGLDIGAHTAAETALSILAEIVAARSGRDGGRLKEARGRIHADVA